MVERIVNLLCVLAAALLVLGSCVGLVGCATAEPLQAGLILPPPPAPAPRDDTPEEPGPRFHPGQFIYLVAFCLADEDDPTQPSAGWYEVLAAIGNRDDEAFTMATSSESRGCISLAPLVIPPIRGQVIGWHSTTRLDEGRCRNLWRVKLYGLEEPVYAWTRCERAI